MLRVEFNGRSARIEDIHRVATWNYGHFTSMQVRQGAVRGLDPHLERLEKASRELFPDARDSGPDRLRGLIRHALDRQPDASVRVAVIPRDGEMAATDVMVSVSEPLTDVPEPAWHVRTVTYERDLPHLKHVATMGLTHQLRQAREAGFDDVLFVGRDGCVREGSEWNIAFWDGAQVVWPEAEALPGIAMHLLRQGLRRTGVPWTERRVAVADLPGFAAAAATNSICPSQPLAGIGRTRFAEDDGTLNAVLLAAWAEIPWDAI